MSLFTLFYAVNCFLRVISFAIMAYVVMSWFQPSSRFYLWLVNFVAPFVRPFNGIALKVMTRTGWRVDISPWLAMIALNVVGELLWVVYRLLPWPLR